jgi:sugar O-acyltransferase (sialic acid O-acetyltransferase NeuD family)
VTTKPVVIFGASQYADVVYYYLTNDAGLRVVAFTVDPEFVVEPTMNGLPVVPANTLARDFPPDRFAMFIAVGPELLQALVGRDQINRARADRFASAQAMGYELVSYISSRAIVSADLVYGPSTFITENSAVMPRVRLGKNVSLWGANIGHHCTLHDHVMVSGATLGGTVDVGEQTFIGLNAAVRERVRIGKRNIIGMGAIILLDTEDDRVHALPHTGATERRKAPTTP